MQLNDEMARKLFSRDLTDMLIRLGIIAFLVVICARIFQPFMALMLWALILAVAVYPLYQRVARRCGGRQGRAATLVVLLGIVLIGVPIVLLGSSFAGQVHDLHAAFQDQGLVIKQPDPAVAKWPLVGNKIYDTWSLAARDLPALLEEIRPQLTNFTKYLLMLASSTAGGVLQFLGSLIIAGIMLAFGESGSMAMQRIFSRLAGPAAGLRLHSLSTATIRSVATGVIGVAFIQAVLLGVGFIWAGIPAAGILAIAVLLFGIAQLPALLISLPAIAYLWWAGDSTMSNVIFTVYLLLAGMADNFLKPLLLGRGVDAPMPVILLGALGGMISSGIIGLFIGAVLLAVGYQIFMEWVAQGETTTQAQLQAEAAPAETTGE